MGLEDGIRWYNAVTAVMNGRLRVEVDGDLTSEAGEFVMLIYDIFAEPSEFFLEIMISYLITKDSYRSHRSHKWAALYGSQIRSSSCSSTVMTGQQN